jgi:hypothetical protein
MFTLCQWANDDGKSVMPRDKDASNSAPLFGHPDADVNEDSDITAEIRDEIEEAIAEYGSHSTYYAAVAPAADERLKLLRSDLRNAFKKFISTQELEVIDFSTQTVDDLADAIVLYPIILKSLLVVCNIAGRAIKRDLNMKNIDTYGKKIPRDKANQIAGFIKSFLPASIPILALLQADRNAYIDKEMRASKGRWETVVAAALCLKSGLPFKKFMFTWEGDTFELDSAYTETDAQTASRVVRYGVDVKRIEASADVHKRADEIVNKAVKLKQVFPSSKFGAVIYYPLVQMQNNLRDRLRSPAIDSLQFASQTKTSIEQAATLMLGTFGVEILDNELAIEDADDE